MLRLFTAISPPEFVTHALVSMQRGIDGARWAPRENLHITLCFYGDVDEVRAGDLDEALAEIRSPPFSLSVKGAGFFGNENPHAIYAGIADSVPLRALAAACERAGRRVGVKPDTRKYTPHITLAYLAHADLSRVIAFTQTHALFESREWDVDCFGIYSSVTRKSAPSLYRLEADYALRF